MNATSGEYPVSDFPESYQYLCLMTDAEPKDKKSSLHFDTAPTSIQQYGAGNGSSRKKAIDWPIRAHPADSNTQPIRWVRRLPLDLLFTPVNSPTDNTKPSRPEKAFLRQRSRQESHNYARHCRLIGFTPLIEDAPISSEEENSPQFLGPRKVKAKEVAPCALFYKRADVFVSSEMKSQNVLAYSENHYRNIRFDDEISISEIEYAPQPPNQGGEAYHHAPLNTINDGDHIHHIECFRTDESIPNIQREPLCTDREPVGHPFSQDRLTSTPLAKASESAPHFPNDDCFHLFGDDTDSPLTAASGAEQSVPWESPCKLISSDLEQSISSITSSGIQSTLWESTLSPLTRATSPVSSIYSNVVPSCDDQLLRESLAEGKYQKPPCKLMGFSRFTISTENEPLKSSMATAAFDWEQDHGSLADDENESDCSSAPLDSDDDQESGQYARTCFDLIPSPPITGLTKKTGENLLKR
ncbi:hypothetical protein VP01_496g12 [Puccinia sorghi]|uniref:Uncharacterized protein n=1 Tax=Puccinia sorghi TaxID=27349 RepID=A0A0L6ULV4_9BASI|nr:hypothetical protein VP01_496g12 [Puccinia sorghi]